MESMTILTAVFLAVLGAIFGSFAGALVWRLHTKKDFVSDRSECEHCHHKLSTLDLIPIVSWLSLRGRCRYCGKPIGKAAILLEIGLAAYFAGSFLVWPYGLTSLLAWVDFTIWLIAGVGLAILFVYDLRWYLLPDKVVFPLIILSIGDFALRVVSQAWSPYEMLVQLAAALAAVAGLYGLLYYASRGRWVGFGDVKLGIFIGLMLGWEAALLAVFIANIIGTLAILPLLVSGRVSRTSRIPFGPFLIVGFVMAGLWGPAIIDWYFSLAIG